MQVSSSNYLKNVILYTALLAILVSYQFRSILLVNISLDLLFLVIIGLGVPLGLNYGKITGKFENVNVTLLSVSVAPLLILVAGYIMSATMRSGGGSYPALSMMLYLIYMAISAFYGLTISLLRVFLVEE